MPPVKTMSLPNCLLYADDVVLIPEQQEMIHLLKKCERHSLEAGYRWNSVKCVILDSHSQSIEDRLYNQAISRHSSFAYLGAPFKPGGLLDPESVVSHSCSKALARMNVLISIGVNPTGFSKLLPSRLYVQIVRPQMEYRLAINLFSHSQLRSLEYAQNKCMWRIYGAHSLVYQGNVTFGKASNYDRKSTYSTGSISLSFLICHT